MIVVTIEIWPHGDCSYARELGQMIITNDGFNPYHPFKGNYTVSKRLKTVKSARQTRVTNWPRKYRTVWELVFKALKNFEEKKKKI